ncbi:lytic polysaccharide monooxygenase [Nocardia sp. NPDC050413]|uniref:lytic polysaccharide monooxygenase n=1 Tax=Nocardia sp. NPDC050413 TaxID=3155784 RepID=UPI00340FE1F8
MIFARLPSQSVRIELFFIIAALLAPPSVANAHGWVTGPASRQEQCARGLVSCGAVKYEPQSVEGPKGLTNCSANKYPELDDDSLGWVPQRVSGSVTFTWKNTANHRTATGSTLSGIPGSP